MALMLIGVVSGILVAIIIVALFASAKGEDLLREKANKSSFSE